VSDFEWALRVDPRPPPPPSPDNGRFGHAAAAPDGGAPAGGGGGVMMRIGRNSRVTFATDPTVRASAQVTVAKLLAEGATAPMCGALHDFLEARSE
jgi:hypothetical protein